MQSTFLKWDILAVVSAFLKGGLISTDIMWVGGKGRERKTGYYIDVYSLSLFNMYVHYLCAVS